MNDQLCYKQSIIPIPYIDPSLNLGLPKGVILIGPILLGLSVLDGELGLKIGLLVPIILGVCGGLLGGVLGILFVSE